MRRSRRQKTFCFCIYHDIRRSDKTSVTWSSENGQSLAQNISARSLAPIFLKNFQKNFLKWTSDVHFKEYDALRIKTETGNDEYEKKLFGILKINN